MNTHHTTRRDTDDPALAPLIDMFERKDAEMLSRMIEVIAFFQSDACVLTDAQGNRIDAAAAGRQMQELFMQAARAAFPTEEVSE